MKIFILLFLLSCGKSSTTGMRVGEERAFSPLTVSASEKTRLTAICQALASKSQILDQSANTVYRFEVIRKDCKQSSFGALENVDVVIQKPVDRYVFKRKSDNFDFVFPDVETADSGVMGQLCSQLSTLTNPMKLTDGSAIWFSTQAASSGDCAPSGNESCVSLEKGSVIGDAEAAQPSYKIHTREWLKFQMQPTLARYGFYVQRKTISTAFCAINEELATQADLK